MAQGWHAVLRVAALVASANCLAGEPVHIRPRDPRLMVEHLARRLDWRDGLPVSYVIAATQDHEGFLWVAGPGGLSRYDGGEFTTIYREATTLVSGCVESERVVFRSRTGLAEVQGEHIVDLGVPGEPSRDVEWAAAVARDGGVWWLTGNRLFRRDGGGRWAELPSPAAGDDPVIRLRAGRGPSVFAWNHSRLWLVAPDGASREIVRMPGIRSPFERADGSIVIGTNQEPGPVTARVFDLRGGTPRVLFERPGAKLLEMVPRGDRLWISTDAGYFGISEHGSPPLFIDPAETSNASGGIFVDREGSFWSATFRGLVQLPEPETYAVSYIKVARTLARAGTTTWMSAWGELARFEDGPEGLDTYSYGPYFGIVCGDARGRIWAETEHGLVRVGPTAFETRGVPTAGGMTSCTLGPTGTLWIGRSTPQIVAAQKDDVAPRDLHAKLPKGVEGFTLLREDAAGTVWGIADRRLCRAPAANLLSGRGADWTCDDIEAANMVDLAFMPSGDIWIATSGGIVHRVDGRFVPLPIEGRLRSSWVQAIRPSPSGGFWIVSMGGLTRVVEAPGSPGGFEVVEDLSAWQGVPTLNGGDVIEDADGTLWFGTDAGLMKVSADVRRRHAEPPPVVLISANADGRPLAHDRAVDLPYRRNRLELKFAAMSYRDPTAIRYRHRLNGSERWSEPTPNPVFRFVDLAPGRYRVEVEASLDGTRWSPSPAVFAFRVLKPWYLQWPFFAGALAVVALGLALAYRVRVRALLSLERQRTRIAMDLHDEVGSGLGTISVLAGLVAQRELPSDKRSEFAGRIAAVSRELSQALGDIVWSLRPGSGTLDAAWNQIVDRARPLFASGSPALTVQAPEAVPAVPLSVVARRALFLIAIEALHNAARHSGATAVTLGLARQGSDWILSVDDDGRGLATAPPSGRRGLGLDGMRARAAEMRAAISWEHTPGTRVTLRFRPEAE